MPADLRRAARARLHDTTRHDETRHTLVDSGESEGDDNEERKKATPDDVFEYFRASKATSKPQKLTAERRRKLVTRLKASDWPWKAAIDKLPIPNTENFKWQPDFDWLIENGTNAVKLVEGKYDQGSSVPTARKRYVN